MKEKIAFVSALCLASTLAAAECDFPYYPEYADLFSKFDEVTPLMAKKAVMLNLSIGQKPGDIVCEPLLIRTIVGMPAYYMVATCKGDDFGTVRKWNAIVSDVNAGSRMPAKQLAERLAFFFDEKVFRQFTWVSVPTYTHLSTFQAASGGIPPAFWGYEEAYEKAKELYGHDDFDFARIIALGHAHVQAFEFVEAPGKTVTVEVDKYERATVADLEKIRADMRDWVNSWYELFDTDPDLIERNARGWREIELEVPDAAAQKEFPKIAEPLSSGSYGLLDDDGEPNLFKVILI